MVFSVTCTVSCMVRRVSDMDVYLYVFLDMYKNTSACIYNQRHVMCWILLHNVGTSCFVVVGMTEGKRGPTLAHWSAVYSSS